MTNDSFVDPFKDSASVRVAVFPTISRFAELHCQAVVTRVGKTEE